MRETVTKAVEDLRKSVTRSEIVWPLVQREVERLVNAEAEQVYSQSLELVTKMQKDVV